MSDEDETKILEIYKEVAMEHQKKLDRVIWICFIGSVVLFFMAGCLV